MKSLPPKAHSVKVNKRSTLGEEGVSPDTEDYSSTSLDGQHAVVDSDEPDEIQEVSS